MKGRSFRDGLSWAECNRRMGAWLKKNGQAPDTWGEMAARETARKARKGRKQKEEGKRLEEVAEDLTGGGD